MKGIKEFEHESWGWFIDIELNQNKELSLKNEENKNNKNNFENYNYLIKKSNGFNKCIIVFNIIGITTIIYLMFYLFVPVKI